MQSKKVGCFEHTRFYVFSRSSRRLSAGYCCLSFVVKSLRVIAVDCCNDPDIVPQLLQPCTRIEICG